GTLEVFFAELDRSRGADRQLDQYVASLKQEFTQQDDLEYRARDLVDRMALALQASLLVQTGNSSLAGGFIQGRLMVQGSHHYGALPRGVDCAAIMARAWPQH